MGLIWGVGLAFALGTTLVVVGFTVVQALLFSLAGLLLAVRHKIIEVLFPVSAYRKRCLSIRGLETRPELEKAFRKDLARVLCRLFPTARPTGCCCIVGIDEQYTAVLVLHRDDGHLQLKVGADSLAEVTTALLDKLGTPGGLPSFQMPASALSLRCRGCSVRKAHSLVNRDYSFLNPLNYRSKWTHFWRELRMVSR